MTAQAPTCTLCLCAPQIGHLQTRVADLESRLAAMFAGLEPFRDHVPEEWLRPLRELAFSPSDQPQ